MTEREVALLLDEGLTASGRSFAEHLMNSDLRNAYGKGMDIAKRHTDLSVPLLKSLSATVMKNTGAAYRTPLGDFDASVGDLRLVNVTAGPGGHSFMTYAKVPAALERLCADLNAKRQAICAEADTVAAYRLSFEAHFRLVNIHPWVDGNGRMARLLMNILQWEAGLLPVCVTNESKAAYLQALADAYAQADPAPFYAFMFGLHLRNVRAEIATYKSTTAK